MKRSNITRKNLKRIGMKMTVKQELLSIRDTLILANIEADSIADLLENPSEENIQKALAKIEKLKEELEECI